MKYIRDDRDDIYGIKKLQDKILEIMVYIDEFCEKWDIDYCLMAGSALGARRHEGFIPWDDDIDIYMTEKDYSKFRKKFMKYGDVDSYYLQEWGICEKNDNHFITMAKVRLNNTLIEEKAYMDFDIHKGIFVDIFILHNCPNKKIQQLKQYVWGELVVLKGLSVRKYNYKNLKEKILLSIGKIIPTEWVKYHGLKNNYKYMNKKTQFVSGFIDTRDFSRAVFPKKAIFPTKYVEFENVRLKVPNDNDLYLKIQFGENYMELPPVEKREVNKHAIYWDTQVNKEYKLCDEYKLI